MKKAKKQKVVKKEIDSVQGLSVQEVTPRGKTNEIFRELTRKANEDVSQVAKFLILMDYVTNTAKSFTQSNVFNAARLLFQDSERLPAPKIVQLLNLWVSHNLQHNRIEVINGIYDEQIILINC